MATLHDEKQCTGCNIVKPLTEYSHHYSGLKKTRSKCKQCNAERTARWREANKGTLKDKSWERHLGNSYGLTLDQHKALLRAQNHKCYICGLDEIDCFREKLYVDHCHTTGKVRALLCHNCNAGLGHFKENRDLLQTAIFYLEEFQS